MNVEEKMKEKLLRLHDIVTKWGGLNLPGVEWYADRSLVMPGVAVVPDGPIDGFVEYLRSVRIGPDVVIRVPGMSPVRAALSDESLRRMLREALSGLGGLQFFDVTDEEAYLAGMLTDDVRQVFSPSPEMASRAGNKAELRRLGERLGMKDVFPEFCIVSSERRGDVYEAVYRILTSGCDYAVMKQPMSASGDGMFRVELSEDWLNNVEEYLSVYRGELIVEAGYEHVAFSVQWEIDSDGPEAVAVSEQIISDCFKHAGNVISSRGLPKTDENDMAFMLRVSEPFASEYWRMGYRGVCGFDFMRAKRTSRRYLLECNSRVTASSYAIAVGRQLTPRSPSWGIAMKRIMPSSDCDRFEALCSRLGSMLFDGMSGVLPFNVRLLSLDEPQCMVCCIERDADRALRLLADTESRLA